MRSLRTYISTKRVYNINPNHIFDVYTKLIAYVNYWNNEIKNRNLTINDLNLFAKGRVSLLETRVLNNISEPEYFVLAEYSFSHNSNLFLKIYSHKKVLTPPNDIHEIGKEYQLTTPVKECWSERTIIALEKLDNELILS